MLVLFDFRYGSDMRGAAAVTIEWIAPAARGF